MAADEAKPMPSLEYARGVLAVVRHCANVNNGFANDYVNDDQQAFADAIGVPVFVVIAGIADGEFDAARAWREWPHAEAFERIVADNREEA